MNVMDWSQLITSVGFPIALVIGMGVALWKAMVWVAPHLVTLVKAHVDFLSSVKDSIKGLTDSGAKTTEAITILTEKMESLAEKMEILTEQIGSRDKRTEELLSLIATRPCLLPQEAKERLSGKDPSPAHG